MKKSTLQLHLADCRDVMRDMDDGSVNLIVTDPPYFKVKGEPWDRQWSDADRFLAWLGEIADEWRRILAPNGSLYCFASPRLAARVEVMLGQRFEILNHLVWDKAAQPGWHRKAHKESLRSYFDASERVIFAEQLGATLPTENPDGYEAQRERLRGEMFEPLRTYLADAWQAAGKTVSDLNATTRSQMAGHYLTSSQWALPTEEKYLLMQSEAELPRSYADLRREHEEIRLEFDEKVTDLEHLRRSFNVSVDVPYTSVWTYPTVPRYPGKHPCEKPYDMARDIIRASSRPGDLVFDPFMGSGVFGKAALNEGRRFVGCDMTPKYFESAKSELEKLA